MSGAFAAHRPPVATRAPQSSRLTAVLGPTNTGKTYLAIERMCGHASGMIGFPLRLLAREVYDRVVEIKGAAQVALITGEEKIVPVDARYFLCTVESMPADRDVAFVAIDEGQVGADPTRGHVFTDRILHARGYAETMILGSETLRPLLRQLLPEFEIITRPRFSTLTYTPPRKLSRLPKRSVIVAFTAQQVYALAEMLRRQMGGAAVVMGSLSPRTRNAQVAMYQSGEVDYLVATDAIGMGLNMDIAHVAFAGLSKFDGRRQRRLTPAEMAQIAGRAGRYQRDGSFGIVQMGGEGATAFEPEEIERIEGHHFAPLSQLVWRNAALDFSTVPRLVATLEARPPVGELVRGDEAIDLGVLKHLAGEPWAMERAHGVRSGMMRLWAACSLPDYRKTGTEMHTRLVGRVFRHLTEADGRLPAGWIASEVAALDSVAGDISAIADRIAAARTWTYIANRPGWLTDAAHWAERTRDLENRLSDALHTALSQRFVDRRTGLLLRDLKMRGNALRVAVDDDGTVAVEGEPIGTLNGFRFTADPSARAGEKRLLLAAAERHLPNEFSRRTAELVAAPDSAFDLIFNGTLPPALTWNGARIAALHAGRDALNPRIEIDAEVAAKRPDDRTRIAVRLKAWIVALRSKHLAPLVQLAALSQQFSPAARGLVVQLVETMGALRRDAVTPQLDALTPGDRRLLAQCRVRLGYAHVYVDSLLRPEPTRWRLALWAVAERSARGIDVLPPPPAPGRVTVEIGADVVPGFYEVAGFMAAGSQAVRIDMVDRLARAVHGIRDAQGSKGRRAPFVPDAHWVASIGLRPDNFVRLMRGLGYRLRLVDGNQAFAWGGVPAARTSRPVTAPPATFSPFAMLADHPAHGAISGTSRSAAH